MAQKNIRLEVAISKLSLNQSSSALLTLSLFLSFAKKSSQIERQVKPGEVSTLSIEQTLAIDYEELDLSKNKYCLLFIYEISRAGRKRVVGNTPINILQTTRQGLQTLPLQDCKYTNATVELSVHLDFEDRDDGVSSRTSSQQKYGCQSFNGKEKNGNSRYSDSPNVYQLFRTKSPQSQLQRQRVSASKINFRSPRKQLNGCSLSGVRTPDKIVSTTGKVNKTAADLTNAVEVNDNNQHKLTVKVQKIEEQNFLQRSNTSIDYISEIAPNQNQAIKSEGSSKVLTFGVINQLPQESRSRNRICPINIFDYIPSSRSNRFRIKKTIGIKYMPFCGQLESSELQSDRTNISMYNTNEITLPNYLTALQDECRLLADANQQLTAQFITIKQALSDFQEETRQKVEEYENTLKQLRQQLNYLESHNREYARIEKANRQNLEDSDTFIKKMMQENNQLKETLKQKSKIIRALQTELHLEEEKIESLQSHHSPRNRQVAIYCPSQSDLVVSHPEHQSKVNSFERDSERAFETFFDAKRTYAPEETLKVGKAGRIVPNKSNFGSSSLHNNSLPNSIATNETGKSFEGNYSQVIGKIQYERHPRKGYFIDHLENEKKHHSIAQSQIIFERREEGELSKRDKPKAKNYFLNNKYLKNKQGKAEPST